MKKIRVLLRVLKHTKADRILFGYIVFIFVAALITMIVEPNINNYGSALWYCYTVLSTVGFGDIIVVTFVGKLISVLVTVYSLVAIAIITGVIVNFYTQIIEINQKDSLAALMDKLERLPELSKEELEQISNNVSKFRSDRHM